jgi:NDP-sugar pyrophosphorylase family protein
MGAREEETVGARPEPANTDVAVLCGGLGLRLRAAVPDLPKPMAPVGEQPFLELLVARLARFGFRRFVLCAGFKAAAVASHFANRADVTVVSESSPLGTAGALRNALPELASEHVLALNGDSFCRVDYAAMLQSHHARSADVTLAVAPVDEARAYGAVLAGPDGRVTAFREKEPSGQAGKAWVNAGVYALRRSALAGLPATAPLSLETDVFPLWATSLRVFANPVEGPLLDIGTPERYERARRELPALMAGEGG